MFAVFEVDRYTIYLNWDNNKYINTSTIEYGEIKDFYIPQKEGGIFLGWYDKDGKQYTGANGRSLFGWDKVTNNEILYARFYLIEYTISYNMNFGINNFLKK